MIVRFPHQLHLASKPASVPSGWWDSCSIVLLRNSRSSPTVYRAWNSSSRMDYSAHRADRPRQVPSGHDLSTSPRSDGRM